jgi:hypothetical protein
MNATGHPPLGLIVLLLFNQIPNVGLLLFTTAYCCFRMLLLFCSTLQQCSVPNVNVLYTPPPPDTSTHLETSTHSVVDLRREATHQCTDEFWLTYHLGGCTVYW